MFVIVTVLVLSCLTFGAQPKRPDLYGKYETLSRIISKINAHYVEEVDSKKLFYGAYEGMMSALDPHSAFLPPAEKEDLEIETRGEFGGLGIEITLDQNGVLMVITPIEDTPAFRAGVLAGDRIVEIEGKSTKGLSLRDAVQKLRGPKGKPVTIKVLHETGKLEDITIVRDIIKLQSVRDARMVDPVRKIGYVRLSQFQRNSGDDLDAAVKELRDKGMKALILDLRFNPGGLLRAAIEVSDRFLSKGVVVSTKGRSSPEQVFKAHENGTYADFPLAVLISGRSASASEIVSGAIQDHKRGILVGMRTFGKASVQTLIRLEDGKSALRLTTAYYYTPSGRLIHHNYNDPDQKEWGIKPDIEVPVTPEEEVALWNHWRDIHLREAREKNGPDTEKPEQPEQPKPKEPGPPDADNMTPPADEEQQPEVRDKTLDAAVNALKGMMLVRERAALRSTDKAAK
jgi:carboxyl-terminal processing protease